MVAGRGLYLASLSPVAAVELPGVDKVELPGIDKVELPGVDQVELPGSRRTPPGIFIEGKI